MVKKIAKGFAAIAALVLVLIFLKIEFIGKDFRDAGLDAYLFKPASSHHIQLSYLGTSGFIIGYKGRQVVCDPFFSNPNLLKAGLGAISYPPLSEKLKQELCDHVELITISHGHYDHCLDIGNFLKPGSNTRVIADSSILHQLDPVLKEHGARKEAIGHEHGTWIYSDDSLFRIFPMASTHSPHFDHTTLFTGNYTEPLEELPSHLWQWKLYHCSSYIIDILEAGNIYYRLIITNGKLDPDGLDDLKQQCAQRKADMLMPVFWNSKVCKGNAELYYGICQPQYMLLQHWNNFFRSNDKSLQYMRPTEFPGSLEAFGKEGIAARIMLPFSTVEL